MAGVRGVVPNGLIAKFLSGDATCSTLAKDRYARDVSTGEDFMAMYVRTIGTSLFEL